MSPASASSSGGPRAVVCPLDMEDGEASFISHAEAVAKALGGIDILINNAGKRAGPGYRLVQ